MNKKNTLKKTAAVMLGLALTVGATGCSFVTTDNEKDLEQVVATVDITGSLAKADSEYKDYADEVSAILDNLNSDILKRDLVAYYLSVGYQYVENYGYSYEDAFNMLLDGLISREIMIQYAVAYYLQKGAKDGSITKDKCQEYVTAQLNALDTKNEKQAKQKELLKAHPEILTLKYFLTDGGKGADAKTDTYNPLEDYERTEYTLKKSLNSSLDSIEANYITAKEEEEATEEVRTLPTGAGEEDAEYYTTDYDVYTGRNTLSSCGEYEKVDGSTTATRQKAYNAFLSNLDGYNLVQNTKDKVEDTRDVTLLDYYYVELASSLGQALISKYFEELEKTIVDSLTADYVQARYDEQLAQQTLSYENDPDAFAGALENAAADSYILYGLEDFGFVYNILLPFSNAQTEEYTRAQNNGLKQDDLYAVRKNILNDVKGEDLRGTWFSKDENAHYAYQKKAGEKEAYYFFDGNVNNTAKYTEFTHYAGQLPYNGTVTKTDDGYETKANKVSVMDVVGQMEGYIKELCGEGVVIKNTAADGYGFDDNYKTTKYVVDGEVDYKNFVYYKGKVDFVDAEGKKYEPSAHDYFNKNSTVYKMVAAANEMMFAYSTDPGCLNKYMGYSISPYSTNFMKEFEYAAQKAVEGGVGSYYVVPTDYGWHIIISTFVYDKDGEVYKQAADKHAYNHDEAVGDKKVEGSFSNLFYETLKSTAASNYSNEVQNNVLNDYDNEACVTRYTDRYKDLLEMGAK